MNLSRHDPETDMDMDMTPMIDVVFLLIIFFMIITDLTQQDLEELQLPVALHAVPDKPKPDEWRPIVNIPHDGRYIVKGDAIYEPEQDDSLAKPYDRATEWLAMASSRMEKAPFDPEKPASAGNPMIPDEALLLRADQVTPFKYIQKIMELCGTKGVEIWKIQLAASEPEEKEK
jgi:biopolymer transport protein ExbD